MVHCYSHVLQGVVTFWGDEHAYPGVAHHVIGPVIDHAANKTLFSSLRKFPGEGRHPLPQVTKLTGLLVAYARVDEAQRDLRARFFAMFSKEVPFCTHSNTFWFPESGKVMMDTMKPKVTLNRIPEFRLCSDCGVCLQVRDPSPVVPHVYL